MEVVIVHVHAQGLGPWLGADYRTELIYDRDEWLALTGAQQQQRVNEELDKVRDSLVQVGWLIEDRDDWIADD